MFFKKKIIIQEKKVKHITAKTYHKLSEDKKIVILMNMKNRGKLRAVLAVYLSQLPFELFSKSDSNLIELGEKFFEINPNEILIKED